MPVWFVPVALAALRIGGSLALRGGAGAGRIATTAVKYRKPLYTVATQQVAVHTDFIDISKKGLADYAINKGIDAVGGSKSSGSSSRRAASGRPAPANRQNQDFRHGGYRPNNRPGGYMPRF